MYRLPDKIISDRHQAIEECITRGKTSVSAIVAELSVHPSFAKNPKTNYSFVRTYFLQKGRATSNRHVDQSNLEAAIRRARENGLSGTIEIATALAQEAQFSHLKFGSIYHNVWRFFKSQNIPTPRHTQRSTHNPDDLQPTKRNMADRISSLLTENRELKQKVASLMEHRCDENMDSLRQENAELRQAVTRLEARCNALAKTTRVTARTGFGG